ncbi:MAG: glutathione S-transferase N-terminal domain-containing protein [Solirubrobacteraceae bacterium]|jgi:hypothetical protein
MKIYVCYGTWTLGRPLHAHPCGEAHRAVIEAGYQPQVIRSYGLGPLPGLINELAPGRREVKRLTGSHWVPALVTDDGEVIHGSKKIIAWATANPAPAPDRSYRVSA